MRQVNWIKRVYIEGKLVKEFEQTSTIGERRSFRLMQPHSFKWITAITEFVEPGKWVMVSVK